MFSILDEDGSNLYVNEAYADMCGYDPDELLGEHLEIAFPPEDIGRVSEQGRWTSEVVHVTKGGDRLLASHAISYAENVRGQMGLGSA